MAQPGFVALDVEANVRAHAAVVREAQARVVVFPELSLTGYELQAPAIAPGDPRLQLLARACAETGSLALAGAPVAGEDGREYIAVLAFDGEGVRVAYRKMWPGGDEPRRFAGGATPAVVELDGWRIGLAVCRDTGIPEHAARTAELGVDVYAAGVLEHPRDAAIVEERARRVCADHGVWVAVASFAGPAGGGYTTAAGGSGIWNPRGEAVARAGAEPGAIVSARLE